MIKVLTAQLAEAEKILDELNAQSSQAIQTFEQSKVELDFAQTQLDEKKAQGEAELQVAGEQLKKGQEELRFLLAPFFLI